MGTIQLFDKIEVYIYIIYINIYLLYVYTQQQSTIVSNYNFN